MSVSGAIFAQPFCASFRNPEFFQSRRIVIRHFLELNAFNAFQKSRQG